MGIFKKQGPILIGPKNACLMGYKIFYPLNPPKMDVIESVVDWLDEFL